jgi:hypothetical protein
MHLAIAELHPANTQRKTPTTPSQAAERLSNELAALGIRTDIHGGYELALVSVWVELVVWTDGRWYRWWSGR